MKDLAVQVQSPQDELVLPGSALTMNAAYPIARLGPFVRPVDFRILTRNVGAGSGTDEEAGVSVAQLPQDLVGRAGICAEPCDGYPVSDGGGNHRCEELLPAKSR